MMERFAILSLACVCPRACSMRTLFLLIERLFCVFTCCCIVDQRTAIMPPTLVPYEPPARTRNFLLRYSTLLFPVRCSIVCFFPITARLRVHFSVRAADQFYLLLVANLIRSPGAGTMPYPRYFPLPHCSCLLCCLPMYYLVSFCLPIICPVSIILHLYCILTSSWRSVPSPGQFLFSVHLYYYHYLVSSATPFYSSSHTPWRRRTVPCW